MKPDNIVLGFFSFAKFLMYRDLDPANWPTDETIADRPMIRFLLSGGFAAAVGMLGEDTPIDRHISPAAMLHIVDCDSSQTLAVHDVRQGRDLIIQGPPGTGKSQTISNVIASAVADGKTVLFVAEKMAALEVVKRRLDMVGIGDTCLELHSNKANKRAVLEELRRTWNLGAPKGASPDALTRKLTEMSWNLGLPAVADRVIREELIDLVLLGRPALANPHWPVWAARELSYNDPFELLPQDWSWWLRNRPGSEGSHGLPEAECRAETTASTSDTRNRPPG